ncbi:DUF6338 family protein [Kribbella jejuensis]|uniref:Uncharacterized protein n=2 Tax=Kribbella jejuensis TaxID=236068 RepID=A0A542ET05_9ACTN|nr:DUF6338 family protein [Kribbella jejuensis]TQJ18461.1 hypothetical protein FB475_2597 [Kribbella jejuensis]
MPSTFQAAAVLLIAILPGALFTWSYEQQVSRSGSHVADRLIRLAGAAAVFFVLYGWILYDWYRRFVVTGHLEAGRPLPFWVTLAAAAMLAVPWAAGGLIGYAVHARKAWTKVLTGPAPSPRAWDHLFGEQNLKGWIRLKLRDGTWIWGVWGGKPTANGNSKISYASGYPEIQEIYLTDTAEVDDAGFMKFKEGSHEPALRGVGMLVRWDEIVFLEYMEG